MIGGDPFPDALIDLSWRGRDNVGPALALLRLFALGFHALPAIEGSSGGSPSSA